MSEMNDYMKFIHTSRYARWLPEDNRRETWEETVDRYVSYFMEKIGVASVYDADKLMLRDAILDMDVMPSMRCMMTAGRALDIDNVAGYNCSYLPIDHVRCFDELMYILMCGTGVGFSVERQYVNKLPEVSEEMHETDSVIHVADSKIGWASSFRELIAMLYAGKIPSWDVSKVRPAGAPLKTFGGRSSGPQPLVDLFAYTVNLFRHAVGRKLSSLEVHDLVCKTADVVVVGGVRRSALISLSNLSDQRLRNAKMGQWWEDNGQRKLANNSTCYTEKPEFDRFIEEWKSLYDSKSGERGVFNRAASKRSAASNGRRDSEWEFGTNPCSEIILRPFQFCNLSEVVVRPDDSLETLKDKVRLATILGTLQSTLTDFRYLRKVWRTNTEEERLLGVSLTGIMDHPALSGGWWEEEDKHLPEVLRELRDVAIATNKEWAARLGIPESAAITCVKPSGTVSQLVDSASGIHPRFSSYYIRTVRADVKDPLTQAMIEAGYPCEEDITNPHNMVFSFPMKAPEGAIVVDDVSAMEQLEIWKAYQDHWCEHKPSITVYYSDDEFLAIGQWLWENFDDVSGISFLPKTDHVYKQAPYEAIDEDTYNRMVEAMADTNWDMVVINEGEDNTVGSQTMACSGSSCEVVDLT
jgi:ribonucleoside-triphosphate reductase (thioredoxin)